MNPALRRRVYSCGGFGLLALLLAASTAAAQTTALYFDSQPGDRVGQGLQQTWTPADMSFRSSRTDGNHVAIYLDGLALFTSITLHFAAPEGSVLSGVYEGATRYPLQPSVLAGLHVSLDGRACGDLSGRFVVYELSFTPDGEVQSFAADFEQHCEDATPALFGAIRYSAFRSSLVPFDGAYPVYSLQVGSAPNGHVTGELIACGAGQSQCLATFASPTDVMLTAVPNPGYVFVGWIGDCRGVETLTLVVGRRKRCTPVFNAQSGGLAAENPSYADGALVIHSPTDSYRAPATKQVHTPEHTEFAVQAAAPGLVRMRFSVADGDDWLIEFAAAEGETLVPGTYELTAWDRASGFPYLQVDSCYGAGRFRIYAIAISAGTLVSFAADFETPCGPSGSVLTGAVRYRSTRASLLPFDGDYPTYKLHVVATAGGSVSGPGLACGAGQLDCEEPFSSPASVTLQATPLAGYDFAGWSGTCAGTSGAATLTVDRVIQCVAIFLPSSGSGVPPDATFAERTLYVDAPGATYGASRQFWLPADSITTFSYGYANSAYIRVRSYTGASFNLTLNVPPGGLRVGDYEEAYPSLVARAPVLDVSTCSERAGRFRIYEVTYSGTEIASLALDFEVHCSPGGSQALIAGALRYRSSRASIRPFDGVYPLYQLTIDPPVNGVVSGVGFSCGPGEADCTETYTSPTWLELHATPLPGYRFVGWTGACAGSASTTVGVSWVQRCSAVFNANPPGAGVEDPRVRAAALLIASEPGEIVSGGLRRVWLDTGIQGYGTNTLQLAVTLADGSDWSISLRAPGTEALQPATYENAGYMYSSSSTTAPRIAVRSPGGPSCGSGVTGRFQIYEIRFNENSEQLTALAADFEQRCTATSPALRGAVRFNSSRSQLIPFDPADQPQAPPPPPPPPSGGCATPDPFTVLGGGTCHDGGWLPPGMPIPEMPPPPPPAPPSSGGCTRPDPFTALGGGTCYNGGWLPPGMPIPEMPSPLPPPPASPSSPGCPPTDPFAALGGGTCYNGGWLPPGMPTPGTPPPPPSPPTPPPSGDCMTPDPFTALGGGTCYNGGWLPPGMRMPGAATTAPAPQPPPPSSVGCTTPDPFSALGGGTCYNGGWLPPGMPDTPGGGSTMTPSDGCVRPDPFASIPGLVGECRNGGWVPVPRG